MLARAQCYIEGVTTRCSARNAMHSVAPFEKDGRLAQLGEHHVRNVGVVGSNPMPSTKENLFLALENVREDTPCGRTLS